MLALPRHIVALPALTIIFLTCLGLHKSHALQDKVERLLHDRRLLEAQQHGFLNVSLSHAGLEAYTTLQQEDAVVSACVIVRDQKTELLDWIAHHQKLGIGKFYVHDDYSTQPVLEALLENVALGIVHYQYWVSEPHGGHGRQMETYNQCLDLHGHKHKWMAFFDADEFLVIKDRKYHNDLPSFLEDYEQYGALVVNWRMYGGSNHLRPPRAGESALRYFTKCTDEAYHGNVHVKSIVQPRYTEGSKGDPHTFKYKADRHAVASNLDKVDGPFHEPPVWDRIVLNHYYAKTWTEVLAKIRRGSGDGGRKDWPGLVAFETSAVHVCEPPIMKDA